MTSHRQKYTPALRKKVVQRNVLKGSKQHYAQLKKIDLAYFLQLGNESGKPNDEIGLPKLVSHSYVYNAICWSRKMED